SFTFVLGSFAAGACGGGDEQSGTTSASGGATSTASTATSSKATASTGGAASVSASASATASTGGSGGGGGRGGAGGTGGAPRPGPDCTPAVGAPPPLKLTPIDGTYPAPILARSPPNDIHRLFVVSRTGFIYVVEDGKLRVDDVD